MFGQGGALRNKIWLPHHLNQATLIESSFGQVRHQPAHGDHTQNIVDAVATNGQAMELAFTNDGQILLPLVIEIYFQDVLTRHHDIVDGHGVKIENTQQHALMTSRHHGARLGNDGP